MLLSLSLHISLPLIEVRSNTAHSLAGLQQPQIQVKLH